MKKNKKEKSLSLDTLIGANTVFEGSIQSERSVCVEGSIRGRIEAKGEVVVGRQGQVREDPVVQHHRAAQTDRALNMELPPRP